MYIVHICTATSELYEWPLQSLSFSSSSHIMTLWIYDNIFCFFFSVQSCTMMSLCWKIIIKIQLNSCYFHSHNARKISRFMINISMMITLLAVSTFVTLPSSLQLQHWLLPIAWIALIANNCRNNGRLSNRLSGANARLRTLSHFAQHAE